jgi:hypothetical protein
MAFFVYFCHHYNYFKEFKFEKRLQFYIYLVKNIKSLDRLLKELSLKIFMMVIPHEPIVVFENLLIKEIFNTDHRINIPKKHLFKTCQLISSNYNLQSGRKTGKALNFNAQELQSKLVTIFGHESAKGFTWQLKDLTEIKERLLNCFCNNSYLIQKYYNFNENSFVEDVKMSKMLILDDNASVKTADTFRNTTKSTFEKLYFRSLLPLPNNL